MSPRRSALKAMLDTRLLDRNRLPHPGAAGRTLDFVASLNHNTRFPVQPLTNSGSDGRIVALENLQGQQHD